MKTKEELNALREEVETLNAKLAELTEEELVQVSGGDEEERKFTCQACGKQFTSLADYAKHSRLHYIAFP